MHKIIKKIGVELKNILVYYTMWVEGVIALQKQISALYNYLTVNLIKW